MRFALLLSFVCCAAFAQGPKTELLYPNGAPGAIGTEALDQPSLTAYLAPNPNGAAVMVCPGGGYGGLSMEKEGSAVAEWFNSFGVSAFVLKYRLGPRYHHPVMLDDARKGISMIRTRAKEFGVDPNKIGVMGFSAGGHLASSLSTHFQEGERPDFAVLVYPVISFTTRYTHSGSMFNLLGNPPDPALVWDLSSELKVTAQTPPTFLFHTSGDTTVPPENSILYYMALRSAGVPAELHIYQNGPHGVGLAKQDPVLSSWPGRLKDWMMVRGLIPAPAR
ncbi:alpha/beta hydrolase [Paludibaculum fermentans]|uniref:Alpha/beta hydrolase n=1 Tax=Paludibaculum fermentans TaxID=1473598 RepID=A0A7S7NWG1_PALFE|nr:alpha/beta hydrolase [Paludibaculum fermentans]QOY91024.1 alpha/beta hydrolase [Paludibaculum fermentans]